MSETILVTGAAGFIGFHVCRNLIKNGFNVVGFDSLNNYYDIRLKKTRLEILDKEGLKTENWFFVKGDLSNYQFLLKVFEKYQPIIVINLAAQAGVRYSIENPHAYINSNISGFLNILECCKLHKVKSLLYASSSSVYGGNKKLPFSENDPVDHPVSLYAATKRSNELMAHAYSKLFKIPSIGLRFFTVYGPWGRPDMAPMLFAKSIFKKEKIEVFNYGDMSRSFTYIDDVVEILFRLIKKPPIVNQSFDPFNPSPSSSSSPHLILNIGNTESIALIDFINCLENEIGIPAKKDFISMQKGDIADTRADLALLKSYIGDFQITPLKFGIKNFIHWYKSFYDFQ